MSAKPFASLDLVLPDGWERAGAAPGGPLLQAMAPDDDGFRSSVTVDLYEGVGTDPAVGSIADFHEGQLADLLRTMTDALIVDEAQVEAGGMPAITSTIAFRQGFWTITARVWTIQAPGCAVSIVGLCDADRIAVDSPMFDAMIESMQLEPLAGV